MLPTRSTRHVEMRQNDDLLRGNRELMKRIEDLEHRILDRLPEAR